MIRFGLQYIIIFLKKSMKIQMRSVSFRFKPSPLITTRLLFSQILWISILIGCGILFDSLILKASCLILIGIKQFGLSDSYLHDLAHGNLLSNRRWNNYAGIFISFLFFKSFSKYRDEHFMHHKYFATDKDPLVMKYKNWGLFENNKSFYKIFIRPFLGYAMIQYLKHEIHFSWKLILYWLFVFLIFNIFDCVWSLIIFWIIPYISVTSLIHYLSEIQDHYSKNGILTRDSTTFLDKFLNHGHELHKLHHEYPRIPAYRLWEAKKVLNV